MLNLNLSSTTTNHLLLLVNSALNPQLPAFQFHRSSFNCKIDNAFFRNTFKKVLLSNSVKTTDLICLSLKSPQIMEEEAAAEEEERDDAYYMKKSVELARKAIGFTSPNPMVGCVIVKDGKIVGQGFHPKAGQPHAEVFALRDAGDLAENGTAYVSLEPCNHYGRTPPCTEALIKAKVKKVVVGMVDPNPIVASTGLDNLRGAGIEVIVGVEEELCKKLNEGYIHQMLTGKPFVTLRYSMSIDGHILDPLGDEAMEPGGYYSQLLQENDAIAFSSRLLSTHSSIPLSKEPNANQPLRIILGPELQNSALSNEANPNAIFFTEEKTGVLHDEDVAREGIEMVVVEKVSLSAILEHCKRRGLCSLMVDLRADGISDFEEILKEGMEHGLFQKFVVEVCPIWGGGSLGKPLLSINEKVKVTNLITKVVGDHVLLEGYFR